MYSQPGGRPGGAGGTGAVGGAAGVGGGKVGNRYMKGRLPEGVDFAAYPGRSATPLPTAESKGAERINQLKIWNEAATNDDKRRLGAVVAPGGERRTDSFKDARERHSASFQTKGGSGHGSPAESASRVASRAARSGTIGPAVPRKNDMFADRSDSESDEEGDLGLGVNGHNLVAEDPVPAVNDIVAAVAVEPEVPRPAPPSPPVKQAASPPSPSPVQQSSPAPAVPDQPSPEIKQTKACCVIM